MASAVSTYAFVNAKLRARISTLLDRRIFVEMARAKTLSEAMAVLVGTRYEPLVEVYRSTGDVKLCELELTRVERRTHQLLDRHIPDAIRPFTNALLREHEILLLKNAIRLWFERVIRGRVIDDKVAYLLRDDVAGVPVDSIINSATAEELLGALEGTEYAVVVADSLAAVSERQSLFEVEIALDRHYYGELLSQAAQLSRADSTIALRVIGVLIDIQNANWLVRMKHFHELDESRLAASVLPGGSLIGADQLKAAYRSQRPLDPILSGLGSRYRGMMPTSSAESDGESSQLRRLALLEDLLKGVLDQEIHRTLGGYPFTIGTIVAYYLLVRGEVQSVRSVINAKAYGLDPERIEGLL